jgi:tetratricopeptide (TPR) repeat protein
MPSLKRRNLHYVVDGEITGTDEQTKIGVRLLDITQDARPVWSDRFEIPADRLRHVDQTIGRIVGRIVPIVEFAEGQAPRASRSGATGLVLQAVPLMYSMQRARYEEAGRLLAQAMEIDPENAKAAAWGAYWQVWYVGQGWAHDAKRGFDSAQELSLRAIRLDPENAEALGIYAHVCAFLDKNFESAVHYFDRALQLNPNLAFIWALSAPTYCYIGEPEEALRRLDRYRDLAPFDPHFGYWEVLHTIAYVFKGDYEKAVSVGRRNVAANPEFSNAYKPLIAALGHLDRKEEAAPYVAKLLELEPHFTAEYFGRIYPIQKPQDRNRYIQGLIAAGVPAG